MSTPISVPPPAGWISHDDKPLPHICDCEFTDDVGDEHEDKGEGWHYDRKCRHCGYQWRGLHCPHDGSQNPCGKCGKRPTPVRDESPTYPNPTVNGYPKEAARA